MILIIGGGAIAEQGIVPVVGGEILDFAQCDATNYEDVAKAIEAVRPGTVIFTAGKSIPQSIAESFAEDWGWEIQVNLLGAFNVATAAVDYDVRTMIFFASVAGMYGKPNHAGYSASKAGVISLVQSLGMEGHNAYAISPGRVDTPMRERDFPGEDPRTRLLPTQVGEVVRDILDGAYDPGDNVVIRKKGFDTFCFVHKGEPWRTEFAVGQPPVC